MTGTVVDWSEGGGEEWSAERAWWAVWALIGVLPLRQEVQQWLADRRTWELLVELVCCWRRRRPGLPVQEM